LQAIDKFIIDIHKLQWHTLLRLGLSRLPHALLLTGAPGLGKRQFAEQLVNLLLCERIGATDPAPTSCGECPGCRWLSSDSHPDVRYVSPESDDADEEDSDTASTSESKAEKTVSPTAKAKAKKRTRASIKVAAIRELEDFVFVGSHRQGRRVVLITDADAMNTIAANALLKILEEPPATVYFILITSNKDRLLPTLRSRCRQLAFSRPSAEVASLTLRELGLPKGSEALLPLAGGAPLQVKRWHQSEKIDGLKALLKTFQQAGNNPLALAARWDELLKKEEQLKMEFLVEAVQRWVVDVALMSDARLNAATFSGWRGLLQCRRAAGHPLNQLLFLEELATHAMRATGKLKLPGQVPA
jgi:DNA polymerase-3 subunit delta'